MNGGPQLQALKIRSNATLKVGAIRSGSLSWRFLSFSTPCLFMAQRRSQRMSALALLLECERTSPAVPGL
jgi:hypothetical protein